MFRDHQSLRSPRTLWAELTEPLANKRLKLAGAGRLKGIGVLCSGGHGLSSNRSCAGERVARSLSAIR